MMTNQEHINTMTQYKSIAALSLIVTTCAAGFAARSARSSSQHHPPTPSYHHRPMPPHDPQHLLADTLILRSGDTLLIDGIRYRAIVMLIPDVDIDQRKR
jgi:hypothetical protein